FLTLRSTAFRDPMSYFHRYAKLSDTEAVDTATSIWSRINLVNLQENILPTRQRADLILEKGANHMVEQVPLRRVGVGSRPLAPSKRQLVRALRPTSKPPSGARGRAASSRSRPYRRRGKPRDPPHRRWPSTR